MVIIKTIKEPQIELTDRLTMDSYNRINRLQGICQQHEPVALKLELDYKLSAALNGTLKTESEEVNELMYYVGEQLIGYMGICAFGGSSTPVEITGMVHPEYRGQGVFTKLYELAMEECKRRKVCGSLGLCDNKSASGQGFVKKIGASYKCSEFEMYVKDELFVFNEELLKGITFRKAVNSDAKELSRQNAIYFDEPVEDDDAADDSRASPEDEEKRGMTIYLALKEDTIIGKVNLQLINGLGGIYGLGILPEYRGKGFGRALLLKAVKMLKEAGAKDVMLQVAAKNATALNLYKSCGFSETSVMDYFELNTVCFCREKS